MIAAAIFVLICYGFAIVLLYIGHLRTPYFSFREVPVKIKFSVLIPFRNEAENLGRLLRSLQKLEYPSSHFEVLFVNDASTDASEEIIEEQLKDSSISYRILQNTPHQPSPKKTAIIKAIAAAQHSWIITTDADCSVPEGWLDVLNSFICTTSPICVAMPVNYTEGLSFLHSYQRLDNWSLQAVTMGSYGLGAIVLSNGANFAYLKDAFRSVRGYEGNLHITSGDDIFLLEKFRKRVPHKIGYLKSRKAIVTTQAVNSWAGVISQRVRWASKTSKQNNIISKLLGILVFLMNVLLLFTPILALVFPKYALAMLFILPIKLIFDYFFIKQSVQFFQNRFPYVSFLKSVFIYPCITVIVVVSSFSGSYRWKNRLFKKQQ